MVSDSYFLHLSSRAARSWAWVLATDGAIRMEVLFQITPLENDDIFALSYRRSLVKTCREILRLELFSTAIFGRLHRHLSILLHSGAMGDCPV
jgi:hypothetical protein